MEHNDHGEPRRFPMNEGYDRAAVDAYLRDLAAEVETLTRVSGELHQRVQALSGELRALTESLRAGAESARAAGAPAAAISADQPVTAVQPAAIPVVSPAATNAQPVLSPAPESTARGDQDLDGARLVALNMALEGQSRERTDAYLAGRFQLGDRAKLLDEVYAAVDG